MHVNALHALAPLDKSEFSGVTALVRVLLCDELAVRAANLRAECKWKQAD